MSLFVERKEIRMENEKKYTDCSENDVHQQQDFILKGFDFFLVLRNDFELSVSNN